MDVSIHAPAWGATLNPNGCPTIRGFNSRARVGRDRVRRDRERDQPRFNSRARVGRDFGRLVVQRLFRVSIHAPAWGATVVAHYAAPLRHVSIHAPAWGATAA